MKGPDRPTTEVYEQEGVAWTAARRPQHDHALRWVDRERGCGPVVDLGCGPGWHLAPLSSPAIGLDVARVMLDLARQRTDHPLVRASVSNLPFADQSLGGAVASRVHTHLPAVDNPLALADLHRSLQPGSTVLFQFVMSPDDEDDRVGSAAMGSDGRSTGPFAGRLISRWTRSGLADLLTGAGFGIEQLSDVTGNLCVARCHRLLTLPDTVGAGMRLLICGLNPSIYAAEAGVGFARPGNRFWPAAISAGLVSRDREPWHALDHHGVGMTDLVKRSTRRAAELDRAEYQRGLGRVERLVSWLQPGLVCFVGLAGWRAVVDRRATAGLQPAELGDRPVYLMPSTSGLNASSDLADLTEHLAAAARLAGRAG